MKRTTASHVMTLLTILMVVGCHSKSAVDPLDNPLKRVNESCGGLPTLARFVVLDNNDRNILTSTNDQITVSYAKGGVINNAPSGVHSLSTATNNSSTVGKYGDLYISSELSHYCVSYTVPATPVVNDFILSVNGQTLGTIHYEVERTDFAHGCFKAPTFLFNGAEVPADTSAVGRLGIIRLK